MPSELERKIVVMPWLFQKIFSIGTRRSFIYGMAVILLVSAIGVLLALQGWRLRIPTFDLITYYDSAHEFLISGTLPRHGEVGSYGSFKLPGTAWLLVPGMLVFTDLRLFEYASSVLLHIGTLLGLFLLARFYFGVGCACLSVLLYGLSDLGLYLAGSLWTVGRPFFYVWMIYWAGQWVTRKDPRYLAASVGIWAIGMYIDMAITPALFILPALWLLFHPPVRLLPLLVIATLILAIWFPYLQFEATRDFVDLKSQLLRQELLPANYRDAWCDSHLMLQYWDDAAGTLVSSSTKLQTLQSKLFSLLDPLLRRGYVVMDGLSSNFEGAAAIPGIRIVLLLLILASLGTLSLPGVPSRTIKWFIWGRHWPLWLTVLIAGIIICALSTSEFLARHYSSSYGAWSASILSNIRAFQAILVLSGIALLLRERIANFLIRSTIPKEINNQTNEHLNQVSVIVLGLLIPWVILLLVAEPGRPERFWWLWPLQTVLLAVFVTTVLSWLKVSRSIAWLSQLLLILVVVSTPVLSRVDAWRRTGWSGPDAPEIYAVDYIAEQFRSEGRNRAAIGYQIFIYHFMANYHIINPQYKVGAELDLLFKHRHGIINTNNCAEGISPNDEYRIVQTRPIETWGQREYFPVPLDRSFQLLSQFGPYQVFRRQ